MAKSVAARADVPGLGDEAGFGEHGIGGEGLKERGLWIETRVASAKRRAEIETKAVETAMNHPALERADRHLNDQRAVKREAIAGARIVDVELRIVWVQPEPGAIVEPAEGQRRAGLVALAVVVEDDVENGFDAGCVQRVGRGADLLPAARSKARIGRAEHHRVVAPCVGQAERRQVALVDERISRHDLDRGDAELC